MPGKLFSRIFGNAARGKGSLEAVSPHNNRDDGGFFLTVNTDGMSQAEGDALWVEASRHTDVPLFDGHVEHGCAAAELPPFRHFICRPSANSDSIFESWVSCVQPRLSYLPVIARVGRD